MGFKLLWGAALVLSSLAASALGQTAGSSSSASDDRPRPSNASSSESDENNSDESERSQKRNARNRSEDSDDQSNEASRWRRQRDRNRAEEGGRFSSNNRDEVRGDRERREFGISFRTNRNSLKVDDVESDGTASRMGLRVGDEIVTVGGREVASPSQFAKVIRSLMSSEERLPITVWREGRERTVYWTNDGRFSRDGSTFARNDRRGTNDENDDSDDGDPSAFLGVVFDTRYDDAAVVRQVYTNSPAQRAGVRAGDTILSINGDKVSSPDDVTEMVSDMQPGDEIKLQVTHAPPQKLELQLGQRRQPAYAAYRGEASNRSNSDSDKGGDNDDGEDGRHETEDQSNPDYYED